MLVEAGALLGDEAAEAAAEPDGWAEPDGCAEPEAGAFAAGAVPTAAGAEDA